MFVLNYNLLIKTCLFFLSLAILSCSTPKRKLFNADAVHLFYPNKDSILEYRDTTDENIELLQEVLSNKPEERNCGTDGEIRFMEKDSVVFAAGFALSGDSCRYIMQGQKAWRLTFRAGMYLDNVIRKLTSKDERDH